MMLGLEPGLSSMVEEAMSEAPLNRTARNTMVVDLTEDCRDRASVDSTFMKQNTECTLMM
jgi:hypothetical protein